MKTDPASPSLSLGEGFSVKKILKLIGKLSRRQDLFSNLDVNGSSPIHASGAVLLLSDAWTV